MDKKPEIKIVPDAEDDPWPLEILEEEIRKLANLGQKINSCKLKQKTVILLLHDITRIPKTQILKILEALPELENKFLK